jgi:hypothetical protein
LQSADSSNGGQAKTLRPNLNDIGEILHSFVRLIGASLLGLAIFSHRGRIKR